MSLNRQPTPPLLQHLDGGPDAALSQASRSKEQGSGTSTDARDPVRPSQASIVDGAGTPEGYVYRVKLGNKNVKFDGFDQGVLIETKSTGYAKWIDDELNFVEFFEGRRQMLEQAQRQLRAARGVPIRWLVAEEKLAGALRLLFEREGLPIEVIHVAPGR